MIKAARTKPFINVDSPGSAGDFHFINTTYSDVRLYTELQGLLLNGNANGSSYQRDVPNLTRPHIDSWSPRGSVPLTPSLPSFPFADHENGAFVSKMLSSMDDVDGHSELYDLLRRMTLCEDSAPALAIRHSITSLAILYTKGSDKAYLYRAKAISALRKSLAKQLEKTEALQVMAASMLMQIYEVRISSHYY